MTTGDGLSAAPLQTQVSRRSSTTKDKSSMPLRGDSAEGRRLSAQGRARRFSSTIPSRGNRGGSRRGSAAAARPPPSRSGRRAPRASFPSSTASSEHSTQKHTATSSEHSTQKHTATSSSSPPPTPRVRSGPPLPNVAKLLALSGKSQDEVAKALGIDDVAMHNVVHNRVPAIGRWAPVFAKCTLLARMGLLKLLGYDTASARAAAAARSSQPSSPPPTPSSSANAQPQRGEATGPRSRSHTRSHSAPSCACTDTSSSSSSSPELSRQTRALLASKLTCAHACMQRPAPATITTATTRLDAVPSASFQDSEEEEDASPPVELTTTGYMASSTTISSSTSAARDPQLHLGPRQKQDASKQRRQAERCHAEQNRHKESGHRRQPSDEVLEIRRRDPKPVGRRIFEYLSARGDGIVNQCKQCLMQGWRGWEQHKLTEEQVNEFFAGNCKEAEAVADFLLQLGLATDIRTLFSIFTR